MAKIPVARIGAPFGVKGLVRLTVWAADPGTVFDSRGLTDESGRTFALSDAGGGRAAIEGVTDRTAAGKLKGATLYAPRENLKPLAEGEYYHADLIGKTVVDCGGRPLGELSAIHNYGAGDILEISDGRLVPFAFVEEIGDAVSLKDYGEC